MLEAPDLWSAVSRMLTNPAYAGAYAYGKSETKTHYDGGKARQAHRCKPRKEWLALIPDAHEGYVAWEQFEHIQHPIGANLRLGEQAGAAQGGAALMTGIWSCTGLQILERRFDSGSRLQSFNSHGSSYGPPKSPAVASG